MPNKELLLFDNNHNLIKDDAEVHVSPIGQRGHVKIYDEVTGKLLFEKYNKVIIPGSIFTASKHFNIEPTVKLTSYNTALALDNTVAETNFAGEKVCLFAIGTDGCGVEASQVYDVDYTKWISPESLIPFKYELSANDISVADRSKYFGRKVLNDAGRIAYYFKAFESEPTLNVQRIDGTPIDDTIYDSDNSMEAETYIELRMKITKNDCRNFFYATTGINDAKVNTISLLTAWSKEIDGYTYYQNIQPLTKLNIPNESLIDLTKGLDIIYHIYY